MLPDLHIGFSRGRSGGLVFPSLPEFSEAEVERFYEDLQDLLEITPKGKKRFHAKMGLIKDRNCMDLTEAEDIKKKLQECTE